MFVTTAEFLPQHREQRQQVLQIISAAEARGQTRLVEMNQQVLGNLDQIINTLDADARRPTRPPMRADNTHHLIDAARRRAQATRAKPSRRYAESTTPGPPITFEALARAAGVSRSWLYANPTSAPRQTPARRPVPPRARPSRTASAPPTPPCCAASRPLHSASVSWKPTTSGSAMLSPRPSASDASHPPGNHNATRRDHELRRRSERPEQPRHRHRSRRKTAAHRLDHPAGSR